MWTLTAIGLGFFGIVFGGLGDMFLFRALFLLVPVEFVCETCVSCSLESTIFQSKGDRFVDRMKCLFFYGAPLVVTFFAVDA
jgi:hypothetical protein